MEFLTLRLDLATWRPKDPVPADVEIRTPRRSDVPELGALYFSAYEPGVAGASLEEATADIVASFDGAYGPLWPEASAVALSGGAIVGALLTVEHVPWDRTPEGPFIIELFVDRAHRRRGIARLLLTRCLEVLRRAGASAVSLRVLAGNRAALSLYESLGFSRWDPSDARPA